MPLLIYLVVGMEWIGHNKAKSEWSGRHTGDALRDASHLCHIFLVLYILIASVNTRDGDRNKKAKTMVLPIQLDETETAAAIERFVRFVQFETVSAVAPTTGAYKECAAWLVGQLNDLKCLDQVFMLKEAPEDSPCGCCSVGRC